jgi:aspartyl-tRNA(Asn)/glutamyl-tRNA(Gln) amidotransferase subunit B
MALPGVLPVTNRRAVELVALTGLALNCQVASYAKFDRKNYPYPDLLKGYQISQYDLPLTLEGWVDVDLGGQPSRRVGIVRCHLEEDTARLTHRVDSTGETYSLIDMNRAGVPLMEIVSHPDLRSPEEAEAYLVKLRQVLRYIGVTKGNLEEGNFRCDANVSLRPAGSTEYGVKVEIKNMNSFNSVRNALKHEIERQTRELDAGGRIVQETRGWVEGEGRTASQRSKEEAHDYRYFPEPDIPPMTFSPEDVERLRAELPELPDAKRRRFESDYALSPYEIGLLIESPAKAAYFERAVDASRAAGRDTLLRYAKHIANWMINDFARLLNASGIEIGDARVAPQDLHAMIALVEDGSITGPIAKTVFEEMFRSGKPPADIVSELGLEQITGADEISAIVDAVIGKNPKPVADYRAGKQEAIKFLVGQAMRETRGRADPAQLTDLLRAKLGGEQDGN